MVRGEEGHVVWGIQGQHTITELRLYCAHASPYRVMGEEVPADCQWTTLGGVLHSVKCSEQE